MLRPANSFRVFLDCFNCLVLFVSGRLFMESDSVVFGKWDNHGNDMNLRLSAQSSQKVGEYTQLVFKHGNKQIRSIEKASDLRYIIKCTLIRSVDEFDMDRAVEGIELFNEYYSYEIDPVEAIRDWGLEKKIEDIPE